MSDEIERRAVELAVMAAGAVGGDLRAWETRIAEMTPVIAAMLRLPSAENVNLATTPVVTARKVLEADVYRGTYVSSEMEERSHRLLVKIRPDFGKPKWLDADGCEEIRTEPSWTRAGFVMQRKIAKLEPETPVVVFKYVESIEDGEKQARCLVHLEVTGKPRSDSQTPAPQPQTSRQSERQAPQQESPPAAGPPPTSEHAGVVAERFEALTPRQRVAFGRLCAGSGLTDFMNPSDETLDQVLVNLSKIERGE